MLSMRAETHTTLNEQMSDEKLASHEPLGEVNAAHLYKDMHVRWA
jgi:hypothetical protein